MASFWDNLYTKYQRGSLSVKLIYLNSAIFLVLKLFTMVCQLFQWNAGAFVLLLQQPAEWGDLLMRPWSLLSYMFVHERFLHLFFNMLWLYFFGKLFLQWFSAKQMCVVYLLGGLCGGLFYALGYNLIPYYEQYLDSSLLSGSSAAVFAISMAAVFYRPDQTMNLAFLGTIKIKWLAVIMIVMDLLSLAGDNAGGSFAHLGGALFGLLYGYILRLDRSWSFPLKNIFHFKTPTSQKTTYHRSRQEKTNIDQTYRDKKKTEDDKRDAILDKIKESGYDSLSKEEKSFLFNLSNKN